MYFGSASGVFRIYPSSPEICSNYDPRERPWYIAASSGPKNVLLILDISGSMRNDNKLNRLKQVCYMILRLQRNSIHLHPLQLCSLFLLIKASRRYVWNRTNYHNGTVRVIAPC